MTDILEMITFIEKVLRESTDSVRVRQMLREEHRRLKDTFAALERSMEEAA